MSRTNEEAAKKRERQKKRVQINRCVMIHNGKCVQI